MVDANKGKFIVGKVKDYTKRKGWFFGNFADNPLLQSDLVEVAWQEISNKSPSPSDKHFHNNTVEINIVMTGFVDFIINGKHIHAQKGDFWVIWPETIIEQFSAGPNTSLIVIRAPGIENGGKVILK